MIRRQKAELGTFSASAIDLFASALGAFIVIAVVMFPYFPNLSPHALEQIVERLRGENAALAEDLDDQIAQNGQLQGQVSAQQATINQQQGQIAAAQQAAANAQSAAQAAAAAASDKDKQISDLKAQLRGTAFLGVEPDNRRFQLIFDMSGSVLNDAAIRAQSRDILVQILDRMDETYSLRVVTYKGEVNAPILSSWPSSTGFVSSFSPADRAAALRFLDQELQSPDRLGTPTFKVLERAILLPGESTLFLITDGAPQVAQSGPASFDDVSDAVNAFNRSNTSAHHINIIGIGGFSSPENGGISAAMAPLATENGGALVLLP